MRLAHISEFHHVKTAAAGDYDEIKSEVENGKAMLVEHAGCYFVLRADRDGLCVVCAQGKKLLSAAPLILEFAKRICAPSIIFHTKRKGLKRLLSAYPFEYAETQADGYLVYRMVLDGK
ncbi:MULTISPECIES: hypothetical protein [unclassified Pseudoalteromonas]|uniref:hypothetical protein n=1 Tax=unclassified Pseudoalteromonas TaxID=194690 RepID=UPI003014BFC6